MNTFTTDSAKSRKNQHNLEMLFLQIALAALSFLVAASMAVYWNPKRPYRPPISRAFTSIFPQMTDFTFMKETWIVKKDDKIIGYAFLATGKGYGGQIQTLVGLQDANTVAGICIISLTETNGLGSRVTLPVFTDQFKSTTIENVKLKTEGGQIDGITGATISSKAVIDAVRDTALLKASQLPPQ